MDNRRRKYFVKEGDQWGLLIGAAILILVLAIVASGLFYILANQDLEKATYRAHFEVLRNTMQMLLPWLILVNLIGMIVVLVLSIFFTHKVSGPAYHLVKDMRKLQQGDLTISTNFRDRDRLKNVAIAMNIAIERLRHEVADIKGEISELSKVADDALKVKESIARLNRILDNLKT
ncbi:MAG: hypothetical protein CO189_07665 [candidate division Zixibacteria bacterium CG_4_9_14_3_um_filter_46_8]|nr:MAG: hypothetical protein CO189_07665 [candidate division Zixibacteria bacterium CG_4_9_14_3_um_filter_46_8]